MLATSMKNILILLFLFTLSACNQVEQKSTKTMKENLTATEIMQKAHEKAGGKFWRKPKSLPLKGYGIFYEDGVGVKNEKHNTWRVYESTKEDAHAANGKVRIESFRAGKPIFIVSFDGENT